MDHSNGNHAAESHTANREDLRREPRLVNMRRRLLLTLLFLGLLLLAVAGWTVQGVRNLGAPGSRRLATA
jgi:hypothetical protein